MALASSIWPTVVRREARIHFGVMEGHRQLRETGVHHCVDRSGESGSRNRWHCYPNKQGLHFILDGITRWILWDRGNAKIGFDDAPDGTVFVFVACCS